MKKIFNLVAVTLASVLAFFNDQLYKLTTGYMLKNGLMLTAATYDQATLNQYRVNQAGESEIVRQRLYDFQVYPTAGLTQFTFFSLPVGQGKTSSSGATAGTAKTFADTNMDIGGALPRPKNYLVESIEVIFEPGSVSTADTYTAQTPAIYSATAALALLATTADVNIIRQGGWLEFTVGSKTYLTEAPLGTFPPKVHAEIDASIGSGLSAGAIGTLTSYWTGRPYYLDPPIVIESLQNFQVLIKFPAVLATPSGFNGRIGVIFDGVMYRAVQ